MLKNLFKGKPVELPAPDANAPKRSLTEIQQEYTNGCAKLGNLVYQIWAQEQDFDLVVSQLRALNIEGHEAKQAEALAEKKEA